MALNPQKRKRGHSLYLTPVESASGDSTATESNWSPSTTARKTKNRTTHTNNNNNIQRSSSSPLIHNTQPQRHPLPPLHPGGNPDPRLGNSWSQTPLTTLPRSRSGPQQYQYYSTSRYSGSDAEDDEDEDEEEAQALVFSSRLHSRPRSTLIRGHVSLLLPGNFEGTGG